MDASLRREDDVTDPGNAHAGAGGRHAQGSAAVALSFNVISKMKFRLGRANKALPVAADAESVPTGADFADGSLFTKEGSKLLAQLQRDVRRQTGCGADSAEPLFPSLLVGRNVDLAQTKLHDEYRKKRHDCRGPRSGRHVTPRANLGASHLPCIADASCMTARSVLGQPLAPVKIDYLMKCRCTKRRCCNMCRLVFTDKKERVAASQSHLPV
jgi:hypothetical protein